MLFYSRKNKYFKQITSLFVLTVFMVVSYLPIQAGFPTDREQMWEHGKHFRHFNPEMFEQARYDRMPLLVSYFIDKSQNLIYLGWNRDKNNDQRFYIFKKGLVDSEFKLISTPDGLKGNYFQDNLSGNTGDEYVVCQLKNYSKLPKDCIINKWIELRQILEHWKGVCKINCAFSLSDKKNV